MAQQWMSLSQWRVLTFDFIPRPANSLFAGRQPQAYLAGSNTGTSQHANSQWYVDSGVAHHVTNSVDHFLNNISTSGTDQVMFGNGQGLFITLIGKTTFPSAHKPYVTLTLNNLLLVPKITKNLTSVSQFSRDNIVYFEFHPDFCLVKSQTTSEVSLQGSLGKDELYSFGNFKAPSYSSSISPCVHTLTSGNLHSTTLNSCMLSGTTD